MKMIVQKINLGDIFVVMEGDAESPGVFIGREREVLGLFRGEKPDGK